MLEIVLDGNKMKSRELAHRYIKQKLELPEYYGENLDALWDVLTTYDINTKIRLINTDGLLEHLGDYGESLITLFEDFKKENNRGVLYVKKFAFFPFKGEKMCFMHVLINVLDLNEKGLEAKIIVEGEAVKLIKVLEDEKNELYLKTKQLGLFDSICQACSHQMGVLEYNKQTGIPIKGNAKGHPAMYDYIEKGYEIITL